MVIFKTVLFQIFPFNSKIKTMKEFVYKQKIPVSVWQKMVILFKLTGEYLLCKSQESSIHIG